MDRKRLLEMVGNPEFIPGIYNYCDRWCERCAFTRRCLNYATMQQSSFPEGSEITDENVFQSVKESFDLTFELLEDMAKEQGIDLDQVVQGAELPDRSEKRKEAEQNPAAQAGYEYSNIVRTWFEQHAALFEEKGKKLENEMLLGMGDPESALADMMDASEVIRWHQYQIYVKMMRALTGMEDEEEMPELWEEYQRDSDGSAKVALIGIDRSITAWETLQTVLGDESGGIRKIIDRLSKLQTSLEQIFPRARTFVRPGFDRESESGGSR